MINTEHQEFFMLEFLCKNLTLIKFSCLKIFMCKNLALIILHTKLKWSIRNICGSCLKFSNKKFPVLQNIDTCTVEKEIIKIS